MARKNKNKGNSSKKPAAKKAATRPAPAGNGKGFTLGSLRQEIDRLFDEFASGFSLFPGEAWSLELPRPGRLADLVPATDVTEANGEYRLNIELPGMQEKDVEVKVAGNTLTITGEKTEKREEKKKDRYLCERRFGTFCRSFTLPDDVDRDKIRASCKDGVLEVVLPKAVTARKSERKIPIAA